MIDGRARLTASRCTASCRLLDADELLSGDAYIFVRDAYLQSRETFVNDGAVQDNFSDFADDDDFVEF